MTSPAGFFLLQAGGGGGTSPLFQLGIQFALILAIFYFLMIRPQQKQRKQHEEALRNLKKGDEIVTAGGIVGQVVHVKETLKDGAPQKGMDDQVTIRSGDTRLIVERGRIAKIVGTGARAESAAPTSSAT
ncbi:MAG TPA: preprotein translocase subunit YajC [Gemmatimonadaceae bacterium]|nr:preprotein translocase subunit YajC [Gemmatimonadaceae bacterium]